MRIKPSSWLTESYSASETKQRAGASDTKQSAVFQDMRGLSTHISLRGWKAGGGWRVQREMVCLSAGADKVWLPSMATYIVHGLTSGARW